MRYCRLFCWLLSCFAAFSSANGLGVPKLTEGLQPLTEPVLDRVEDLTNTLQEAERASVLARMTEQSKLFSATSLTSLADLPARVDIPSIKGGAPQVDVEVENGWRAVEQEWLVMVTDDELQKMTLLTQEKVISVLSQSRFEQLALTLIKFRAVPAYDSLHKLGQLLPLSVLEKLGRNHIYSAQAGVSNEREPSLAIKAVCQDPLSIGMIDTALDLEHPAFKQAKVTSQHFLANESAAPKAHGTAVAALLVSKAETQPALLPNAKLYAASVFHSQTAYAQGATLFNLINGLEWLLSNNVTVINMSLAGPPNPILAEALRQVKAKHVVVIAAAGNEGPAAQPLYPAAYQDVITATAVDANRQSYRWANRGEHIDYAAFGVSVPTARVGSKWGRESGTSIATPVVSAFVACAKSQAPDNYVSVLRARVIDLGEAGHDPVFGFGLLTP